ncbi:16S rRNA (guanine(527)-N(7))-methyltransferase RsmG [Anabaena sp. FACHB-1237]|nr:16S rRNA (guanine(527)-N(7))-methyltransferase RsmG [Anabaena sp. FACHB-1237]MBD2139608.1 16S rRNA (guanine(527)-N(7))-methyltransferase RsmG [Anabaena sp. FACHB-1237]
MTEIIKNLPKMLDIWEKTLHWQPNTLQQEKLQKLYELIITGNRQFNLTRITEPEEFWEKHLWDSLRGVAPEGQFMSLLNNGVSVIDIGTGAGFPGLPIAMIFPNSQVTLLDSTRKKINFIDDVINNMSINNAKTLVGRVEEIGQEYEHREKYDLAVIRAVGNVSICVEYALPLVKKRGLAIIYRGSWSEEENASLENAVELLGGNIELIEQFTTPISESMRHCLYLRKIKNTPIHFPRGVGIPKQKPL